MFNVVLIEPEIPPNTGNIARLCAASNTRLHLVEPLGFSLDEKHLKRAGMDYWNLLDWRVWPSWETLLQEIPFQQVYFLTTKCRRSYTSATFKDGDYLVFGRETKGLPESLLQKNPDRCLTIPLANSRARSLNLATCAGIVLYEALRQTGQA